MFAHSFLTGSHDDEHYTEEKDDTAKVNYLKDALDPHKEVKFTTYKLIPSDLEDALQWYRGKTPSQVMEHREAVVGIIEEMVQQMKASGQVQRWQDAIKDPKIKKISEEVNGPLLELLATKVEYHDAKVIELFREGAPLVGVLPKAGLGKLVQAEPEISFAELNTKRESRNKLLINSMKEDRHAKALLELCKDDVAKGRMLPA